MRRELAALAEDPELFVEPPVGSVRVVDDRYCVVIGPERRWASVCRLRLLDQAVELVRAVSEIRDLVAGVTPVLWNVGSSATADRPSRPPARLRSSGPRPAPRPRLRGHGAHR